MPTIHSSVFGRVLVSSLLALGMTQAIAASPTSGELAAAQARFQQEMALCASGQSNQSRPTCQTEARNALQAARRGDLSGTDGSGERNATLRCAAHQGLDRVACEARMRGQGTRTEGSVGGGGILRETTIVVVPGS